MCVQESMQDAPVMQCPSRTLFAARIHLHARKICNIAESGRVRCVSCVYKFSSSRNVTPLRAFHIPPPAYRLASLSAFFFLPSGFCFVLLASSLVVIILQAGRQVGRAVDAAACWSLHLYSRRYSISGAWWR